MGDSTSTDQPRPLFRTIRGLCVARVFVGVPVCRPLDQRLRNRLHEGAGKELERRSGAVEGDGDLVDRMTGQEGLEQPAGRRRFRGQARGNGVQHVR